LNGQNLFQDTKFRKTKSFQISIHFSSFELFSL
jgi:hypothetical protein